ncbi:hypothetical protein [Streptomyces sp. NPDC059349]|uniref:hypothetical protein n=1 Tax=Streptomyces sp. NPDC059349 TaxID=3346808 RepID=UPI00369E9692
MREPTSRDRETFGGFLHLRARRTGADLVEDEQHRRHGQRELPLGLGALQRVRHIGRSRPSVSFTVRW